MRAQTAAVVLIAAALMAPTAYGQASPAPPANLTARDHPWDNGTRIDLNWSLSGDDASLQGYVVRKKTTDAAEFSAVEIVPPGTSRYTVSALNPETRYTFEVAALSQNNTESAVAISEAIAPGVPPTLTEGGKEEGPPTRAALPLSSRGPAETVSTSPERCQTTCQTTWTPIEARIQLTDAGDRGD